MQMVNEMFPTLVRFEISRVHLEESIKGVTLLVATRDFANGLEGFKAGRWAHVFGCTFNQILHYSPKRGPNNPKTHSIQKPCPIHCNTHNIPQHLGFPYLRVF